MLPKVKAELVIATLEIDVNEIMNMTLLYAVYTICMYNVPTCCKWHTQKKLEFYKTEILSLSEKIVLRKYSRNHNSKKLLKKV